jgi:NAD(P)-dependent dehydrogenase (short-subunit alcohol dehydrogenase family)
VPYLPRLAVATGADSGIRKTAARLLATEGFDIGLTVHSDTEGAEESAREVTSRGQHRSTEPFDAASSDAGEVVDRLATQLGGLGVLVNIAGTGHLARVVDLLLETRGHTLATDLDGRSSAPSTRPY